MCLHASLLISPSCPLTHVLQSATDGVCPLTTAQVSGEPKVSEFEMPWGGKTVQEEGVTPCTGCPHANATRPSPLSSRRMFSI